MTSNREKGDEYEITLLETLNSGLSNNAKNTGIQWHKNKGSGSVHGDSDLALNIREDLVISIDAKYKNTKNIIITSSEVMKAALQAASQGSIGAIATNVDNPLSNVIIFPITNFTKIVNQLCELKYNNQEQEEK